MFLGPTLLIHMSSNTPHQQKCLNFRFLSFPLFNNRFFCSKLKKWSATFHIVWRIPIVLYVFCCAIDQKLGLSRKFGAEVFDKRLLSPHSAMHQQRPRIIAGLPPSGQTTYSCFCIDEVGLLHSVRLSVRCPRFTQNQNVVET